MKEKGRAYQLKIFMGTSPISLWRNNEAVKNYENAADAETKASGRLNLWISIVQSLRTELNRDRIMPSGSDGRIHVS